MSRAATLPGAAARSPRAVFTNPHFAKLQPWRPRAGGTAPGERQGCKTSSNFASNSTLPWPGPGTIRPRPAGRLSLSVVALVVELAPERH